jgi:predicted nuclease with TOPRIM domain
MLNISVKIERSNREINDRLVKIKEAYTKIKINHDNLLVAYELLSCETHVAINPVVKLDIATSCDDLTTVDQSSLHEDLVEKLEVMSLENKKLKKYLTDATTKGKFAIEIQDLDNELMIDNERLREEIKKLKLEKDHLATSVQKFNKGQYLQNELLMNTVMKNNKSDIGYNSIVQKKV